MTKYESQVYTVQTTQEQAYARLADLHSFESIKLAFSNPEMMSQILERVPNNEQVTPEKLDKLRETVEKMEFTADSLTVDSQLGRITLNVVEREAPKLIKFETEGTPMGATLWVQLLPQGTSQAALKVTVGAELNFFIRKMVEKHLKQAPDGIATFLSQILSAGAGPF